MLLISLRLLMTLFFDLIYIIGLPKNDKELEIFILRQQVRILQRKTRRLRESLIRKEYYCQI